MIVVDSSVWIDSIRGASTPQVTQLQRAFRADEVLVGDLVLLEVLRGGRHDRDAQRLERTLRQFAIVPTMSEAIARKARGSTSPFAPTASPSARPSTSSSRPSA